MTYKMVFTKEGIKTKKNEWDPLMGCEVEVNVNALSYEDLSTINVNIDVTSIVPDVSEGFLKSLEMEFEPNNDDILDEKQSDSIDDVGPKDKLEGKKIGRMKRINGEWVDVGFGNENSETGIVESVRVKRNEILRDDNQIVSVDGVENYQGGQKLRDYLTASQRAKHDEFVRRVQAIGDPKIRVEEHKLHTAIKYDYDRAKAWIVIKASGNNLSMWFRGDTNLDDPMELTRPYNDISRTHGNYKVELMSADMDDIMYLIEQSYQFRKKSDFSSRYKEIVKEY